MSSRSHGPIGSPCSLPTSPATPRDSRSIWLRWPPRAMTKRTCPIRCCSARVVVTCAGAVGRCPTICCGSACSSPMGARRRTPAAFRNATGFRDPATGSRHAQWRWRRRRPSLASIAVGVAAAAPWAACVCLPMASGRNPAHPPRARRSADPRCRGTCPSRVPRRARPGRSKCDPGRRSRDLAGTTLNFAGLKSAKRGRGRHGRTRSTGCAF